MGKKDRNSKGSPKTNLHPNGAAAAEEQTSAKPWDLLAALTVSIVPILKGVPSTVSVSGLAVYVVLSLTTHFPDKSPLDEVLGAAINVEETVKKNVESIVKEPSFGGKITSSISDLPTDKSREMFRKIVDLRGFLEAEICRADINERLKPCQVKPGETRRRMVNPIDDLISLVGDTRPVVMFTGRRVFQFEQVDQPFYQSCLAQGFQLTNTMYEALDDRLSSVLGTNEIPFKEFVSQTRAVGVRNPLKTRFEQIKEECRQAARLSHQSKGNSASLVVPFFARLKKVENIHGDTFASDSLEVLIRVCAEKKAKNDANSLSIGEAEIPCDLVDVDLNELGLTVHFDADYFREIPKDFTDSFRPLEAETGFYRAEIDREGLNLDSPIPQFGATSVYQQIEVRFSPKSGLGYDQLAVTVIVSVNRKIKQGG